MITAVYIGIDVTFEKRKYLPIVIARWKNGQLVPYPLRTIPFKPPKGLGNRATLAPPTLSLTLKRCVIT
jgi:hypothetical protein